MRGHRDPAGGDGPVGVAGHPGPMGLAASAADTAPWAGSPITDPLPLDPDGALDLSPAVWVLEGSYLVPTVPTLDETLVPVSLPGVERVALSVAGDGSGLLRFLGAAPGLVSLRVHLSPDLSVDLTMVDPAVHVATLTAEQMAPLVESLLEGVG